MYILGEKRTGTFIPISHGSSFFSLPRVPHDENYLLAY